MAWARDEVLFRAQFRLIGLWSVHNRVSREQPDRSPPAVQQETFELVRSLVDEGLVVIGDRTEQGSIAWTLPVGDGLERIHEQFLAELAGEEPGNFDQPWLQLTDAGRQAAKPFRSIPTASHRIKLSRNGIGRCQMRPEKCWSTAPSTGSSSGRSLAGV